VVAAQFIPQQVTATKCVINVALLRSHLIAGVTRSANNHFALFHLPKGGGWTSRPPRVHMARTNPAGSYNALMDLILRGHLGGKTVLL
jgi:hypothetical protein